jgi:hypothetical protein
MGEKDTLLREREMNLVPTTYKLDEYELPDHLFLTGELDIEMDHVDGEPYIWAFQLKIHNTGLGITVDHNYQQGRKDNWFSSVELVKYLHRDKKLMDDIYDKCAVEGMWSE